MWYFNQDAKQQTLGLVKQAGFGWVKHQVEWMSIETAPGQYDWSELDAIVATATSCQHQSAAERAARATFLSQPDQRPLSV